MDFLRMMQFSLECWGAVFILISAVTVFLGRYGEPRRSGLLFALMISDGMLLVADAVALAFRGVPTNLGGVMVRVSNAIVFLMVPTMGAIAAFYILEMARETQSHTGRSWIKLAVTVSLVHALVVLVSQFTNFLYYFDSNNIYHRTNYFAVVSVLAAVELLLLTGMTFYYRNKITVYEMWSMVAYILLPSLTNVIQLYNYGLSLNNIAASVSLLLVFMTHEVEKSKRIMEQEKVLMQHQLLLSQQATELAEKRIQISISQMRPHFIFNALGSIEQLCRTDAQKAATAIHHFAQYIRRNLRILSSTELVPFEEEMGHVRTYVWLEKMRFGDDVEFREDLQCLSFELPSLAVQPLVENAIKHGMMDTEEGILRVCVHSEEREDCYLVSVFDDGCGFDPALQERDPSDHIGLMNVKERIKLMMGGEVRIQSDPGAGTMVEILIPKKDQGVKENL